MNKNSIFGIFLALIFILGSCEDNSIDFSDIQPGLDVQEMVNKIGQPTQKEKGFPEKWFYPGGQTVLLTNGKVFRVMPRSETQQLVSKRIADKIGNYIVRDLKNPEGEVPRVSISKELDQDLNCSCVYRMGKLHIYIRNHIKPGAKSSTIGLEIQVLNEGEYSGKYNYRPLNPMGKVTYLSNNLETDLNLILDKSEFKKGETLNGSLAYVSNITERMVTEQSIPIIIQGKFTCPIR